MADSGSCSDTDSSSCDSGVTGDTIDQLRSKLGKVERKIETLREKEKAIRKRLKKERDTANVNRRFDGMDTIQILRDMVKNLAPTKYRAAPAMSKSACLAALRGLYINIFDYCDEEYDRCFNNRRDLIRRCDKRGYFPAERAKNVHLAGLLRKLFFA